MPNNRCVAEQRAASLKKKLRKNEVFLEDYKAFMENILDKGYAIEVPQEQLEHDDNRVWYVPHHGVYHPKKKKMCVVFDCTVSFQDVSLNGQLLQGPDLTNMLIAVLVRFREDSIVIMADIESMEHIASELKDLDLTQDTLPTERALGVQWCTEEDTFAYSIKLQDKSMTRRGILSVVNSIYDPLGFLAPVVLLARLLSRDLCKEKQGWYKESSGRQADQWCKWLEDLIHLSDFSINRCVKPMGFGHKVEARLHNFSDASENAYGTASCLVLVNEQGRTHCSFVMRKSRVAPLKQVTIPRLELTAAVVAVKVYKMLQDEMQVPLQQSIFWTDSMTVLRYVNSETAPFKTFVANGIALI
ncbi:hypothetical protein SKAU_G00282660 [Synaphobranchus kaupii]|uniref:Uncharacterized protein n=1 Tax=Synaphobranchus kaupii TaxID=118154 RepID=A0A9Q1EXG3_SYNKA|nr:hypothetical protein SKAU_G00282660 [Synaphobranchus kaupii]